MNIFIIDIEIVCFSKVLALLLGKSNFKAFGLTRVDVKKHKED